MGETKQARNKKQIKKAVKKYMKKNKIKFMKQSEKEVTECMGGKTQRSARMETKYWLSSGCELEEECS